MKKVIFIVLFLVITSCNQSKDNKIDNDKNDDFNKSSYKNEPLPTHTEISEIAINSYTEVISRNPNDNVAYFGRGQSRMDLEDYKGAVDDFTKSIKIDEMFLSAYLYRADSYMKLGMRHKACLDWERAVLLGYPEVNDSIKKNCN
jgi:tetratricopeptide (TPR) repeat protein